MATPPPKENKERKTQRADMDTHHLVMTMEE